MFMAEIFAPLGKFTSLSLPCALMDAITCLLEESDDYLSWMLVLLLWWNILGKRGFILLSLGIGKEISAYC
jgi:hypothetical protein